MGRLVIQPIKIKVLLALFVCFLLLRGQAFAQEASPTDDIIVKTVDAQMFQITANMQLNDDEVNQVRSIVTDEVLKERNLQLSVESGAMDSRTMYDQKLQIIKDRNQALSQIFSADQMRIWMNMEQYQA